MRMWIGLCGLVLLAAMGCTEPPTPIETPIEQVRLDIPFEESFPDTTDAKRIVVCQFNDRRKQPQHIGVGGTPGVGPVHRYVPGADLTLVLPRILGGYLKRLGFNVAFAGKAADVRGDAIREIIKTYKADLVILGTLNEFSVSSMTDASRTILVGINSQVDVYNDKGQMRARQPAAIAEGTFLGGQSDDPAAVSAFVNEAIRKMFEERVFADPYFMRALELEPGTVEEMMKAKPVEEAKPEEKKPEEAKPAETTSEAPRPEPPVVPAPEVEKPKELTEKEKAEQERLLKIRELERAIEEAKQP